VIRHARTAVTAVALLAIVGGCTSTTTPLGDASPGASEPAPTPRSPTSSPAESQALTPTATPTATPVAATPDPTDPPPTPTLEVDEDGWAKPVRIADGDCYASAATIDERGRYHVAASCDDELRSMVWSPGAIDLHVDVLPPPDRHLDVGAELALDGGDTVMAFTRLAPTEGGDTCGNGGYGSYRVDGVYVRRRADDTAAWSDPVRLGDPGDDLQAFRAADGMLHATVIDDRGRVFYVSGSGAGGGRRVLIPDATETSLRIGDDGRPRIAYTSGLSIRYARVDGDRLVSTEVTTSPGSSPTEPTLVLAPGDDPSIMWTQDVEAAGGCASPDTPRTDGTYLARRSDGIWDMARVSRSVGPGSLTLDPPSGRWHAVISDTTDDRGWRYLTGTDVDDVSDTPIPGTGDVVGATIRIDPDGTVAVIATRDGAGIDVLRRP
jgi:hypothetical protein